MIFIAYNIFCESIERMFDPVSIHDEGLLQVSVAGLIVNMVGIAFFHDFKHAHPEGESCSHGKHHDHSHVPAQDDQDEEQLDGEDNSQIVQHGHDHHPEQKEQAHDHEGSNANIHGILLHIVADALGSVGVIISSILIKFYNIQVADPICSSVISLLIFASVLPLIKSSSEDLLLKCPPSISRNYHKIIN